MIIASMTVILMYGQIITEPQAELANVIILRVKRQGIGHNMNRTSGVGNREFYFRPDDTTLEFANDAGGVVLANDALGIVGEEVYVKFKY